MFKACEQVPLAWVPDPVVAGASTVEQEVGGVLRCLNNLEVPDGGNALTVGFQIGARPAQRNLLHVGHVS